MITIPKEIQQALHTSQGQPIRLTDPDTHIEYILLRAEVYDQLHGVFYDDSPLTQGEKRALLIHAGLRAGWDDPEMDVYDELDPRRQP